MHLLGNLGALRRDEDTIEAKRANANRRVLIMDAMV